MSLEDYAYDCGRADAQDAAHASALAAYNQGVEDGRRSALARDCPLRVERVVDFGGPLVWVDLLDLRGRGVGQLCLLADDLDAVLTFLRGPDPGRIVALPRCADTHEHSTPRKNDDDHGP